MTLDTDCPAVGGNRPPPPTPRWRPSPRPAHDVGADVRRPTPHRARPESPRTPSPLQVDTDEPTDQAGTRRPQQQPRMAAEWEWVCWAACRPSSPPTPA